MVRRDDRRGALPWVGLAAAPLAWAVQLIFVSQLEETSCESGGASHELLITVVGAAALAVALIGLAAAWRSLSSQSGETGQQRGTTRALALAGLGSSALFLALIAFGFVFSVVLEVCAY